jgi:cytochrome c biogenesis protein CcmG, thiol:disulfide interchange protein DsbE
MRLLGGSASGDGWRRIRGTIGRKNRTNRENLNPPLALTMPQRSAWMPYAGAAMAAALVVLFAWVNRDRLNPVAPGRAAPSFTAFDLQGDVRTLADYRGKVLLVNIWATWCPPCQEEMPSMERLYREIDHQDFEILAVSVDAAFGSRDSFGRPGGDLESFGESMGLTFTILHDPSGRIQQTFQTTGIPESFVLDRGGTIIKKVAGATAWDAPVNVELIRRLLGD